MPVVILILTIHTVTIPPHLPTTRVCPIPTAHRAIHWHKRVQDTSPPLALRYMRFRRNPHALLLDSVPQNTRNGKTKNNKRTPGRGQLCSSRGLASSWKLNLGRSPPQVCPDSPQLRGLSHCIRSIDPPS